MPSRRPPEHLSKARRKRLRRSAAASESALGDLAMTRTRCEVRFTDADDESHWSERGLEQGEFYISPNPGEDVRPLARIASGGELSRIMLALKTLATTDAPGKTLIFDEVDAGIGGAVADVVGKRLQALGESVPGLASPTCRRSPRTGRRTSGSPRRSEARADGDRRRARWSDRTANRNSRG